MNNLTTDILILGGGGAGLFAALHAKRANPDADVTIAVKGLLGQCGCTRMVQGGYNVALDPRDSIERHFMDTIEGGSWLNDQDLAWLLVTQAPARIRELENEFGCVFDRNPDGSTHQKALAGQTFDRTVYNGEVTGVEIINHLAEHVRRRNVRVIEDYRALDLIPAADKSRLAGVLMLDMRCGEPLFVHARATLLATGGGPTMYRYHTPADDKSCDGMAMALRAGLPLRDMEMVQFHPTGLLAGPGARMTAVLEDGLRGAGGYLLDSTGWRFMFAYDPRGERATRDIVSRSILDRIRKGLASPDGAVWLSMSHLGPDYVRRTFKRTVERCAACGFDLAGGKVEVVPSAHCIMGGVVIAPDCATERPGVFAAGEDSGGVHGANCLGGNGLADCTVFGGLAGASMAMNTRASGALPDPDGHAIDATRERAFGPLGRRTGDLRGIRERLAAVMWDDVGIVRTAEGLARARHALNNLATTIQFMGVPDGDRRYKLAWMDRLDLENLVLVSRAICVAAEARRDSRGAHFREDFPATSDLATSRYTVLRLCNNERFDIEMAPVAFTRVTPGASLLTAAE